MAQEGDAFVSSMDEGALPDAFVAWFEAFNVSFSHLRGGTVVNGDFPQSFASKTSCER